MSPNTDYQDLSHTSFPRVSGDEPDPQITEGAREQFSPRERG